MCCEVLPQYMYVLRAYLTVKTYVLRGVLERQTPWRVHGVSRSPRWEKLLLEATTCLLLGLDVYGRITLIAYQALSLQYTWIHQAVYIDLPIIIYFISRYTAVLEYYLYTLYRA